MIDVNDLDKTTFEKYISSFYKQLLTQQPHRYKSWEYCYKYFSDKHEYIASDDKVLDTAALNLAFYLASWGMYRGSSFLLQTDYTVHKPAITIIMKAYNLKHININEWQCTNTSQLFNTVKELEAYYLKVKKQVKSNKEFYDKENNEEKSISDTLLTKILLGTLGITPAYDRYFKNGLNLYNMIYPEKKIPTIFNEKNFNNLIKFCKTYSEYLKMNLPLSIDNKMHYPLMKKLDMFFWNIGLPWAIPDNRGNYFIEGKEIINASNNQYIKIYTASANDDCFEKKYFEINQKKYQINNT